MFERGEVAAQHGGWGSPGGWRPAGSGGGYGDGGSAVPPGGGQNKPITGGKETMAIHALSIDPSTGLPIGEQPPAGTMAVVSLVFGVLLCLPFAGAAGLVTGLIAYLAARRNPAKVGGSTMALIGMALSALNLAGWSLGLLFWVLSLLV